VLVDVVLLELVEDDKYEEFEEDLLPKELEGQPEEVIER
jgi:hypothetical protein